MANGDTCRQRSDSAKVNLEDKDVRTWPIKVLNAQLAQVATLVPRDLLLVGNTYTDTHDGQLSDPGL